MGEEFSGSGCLKKAILRLSGAARSTAANGTGPLSPDYGHNLSRKVARVTKSVSSRLPAIIVAAIAAIAFIGMLGYSLLAKRISEREATATVRPRSDTDITKVERPGPRS